MHSFIQGQFTIATTDVEQLWSATTPLDHSIAYWCTACSDVWGRVVISSAHLTYPIIRPCTLHGVASQDQSAGSFIHPWLPVDVAVETLPPEILAYEAQLCLNWKMEIES